MARSISLKLLRHKQPSVTSSIKLESILDAMELILKLREVQAMFMDTKSETSHWKASNLQIKISNWHISDPEVLSEETQLWLWKRKKKVDMRNFPSTKSWNQTISLTLKFSVTIKTCIGLNLDKSLAVGPKLNTKSCSQSLLFKVTNQEQSSALKRQLSWLLSSNGNLLFSSKKETSWWWLIAISIK